MHIADAPQRRTSPRSRTGTAAAVCPDPDPWSVAWTLDQAARSRTGRRREINQDHSKVSDVLPLFAIADGLGGHAAGDRASFFAVEAIHEYLIQAWQEGDELSPRLIEETFLAANTVLHEDGSNDAELEGMGTQATALLLTGERFLIGHVGGGRVWKVRGHRAEQLTDDHTLVAEQVRQGVLTPEQAANHPLRKVLSRCLGRHEKATVDLIEGETRAGDTFVVASDGLARVLPGERLVEIVRRQPGSAAACSELIGVAADADAPDDATVIVVRCR